MGGKPSYEELEQRIKERDEKAVEFGQVEKVLRESEERFRSFYEKTPLGYQSLDLEGHFIEVNQAWLDMLGYTRNEVIGKPFGDFLHPDWQEHCKENFSRFLAIGEILGIELEMVRKDGAIITVFFNGKIIRDKKGNFKQTHCILLDITGRKKAEEENEQLLAELEAAQVEIQSLRKLVPVCLRCRTICEDKGFHHKVEAYIKQRPDAEIGHCICPECKR
jgi:PAS domain S-box-containing protein